MFSAAKRRNMYWKNRPKSPVISTIGEFMNATQGALDFSVDMTTITPRKFAQEHFWKPIFTFFQSGRSSTNFFAWSPTGSMIFFHGNEKRYRTYISRVYNERCRLHYTNNTVTSLRFVPNPGRNKRSIPLYSTKLLSVLGFTPEVEDLIDENPHPSLQTSILCLRHQIFSSFQPPWQLVVSRVNQRLSPPKRDLTRSPPINLAYMVTLFSLPSLASLTPSGRVTSKPRSRGYSSPYQNYTYKQ